MSKPDTKEKHFQTRLVQSTRKVFYWTIAWMLATSVLAFGPKFIWSELRALTLVAVAINVLAGIGLIVVFKNHLKDSDELQQKIALEAMGITLGAVMVVGIPYELIREYNILPFRATVSHLYFVMGLTFMTFLYLGYRRYR